MPGKEEGGEIRRVTEGAAQGSLPGLPRQICTAFHQEWRPLSSSRSGRCFQFGFFFLRYLGCKAILAVVTYRAIDDGAAVDTFPGVEDQEKIREPFQLHQPLALRTIHN